MTVITIKSGIAEGQTMHDFVALAKGLIGPNDLTNGGQLRAQEADKLISMLFADPFLKKITTIRMARLTRDVDVMDILHRQLRRVPEGQEPSAEELTAAGEFGCKLTALDAQLFASLKLSFLRENASNPMLQQEVEAGFNTRLTNDIVDLGFNGIADDAAGANPDEKFLRLNKGWVQVAREAENTPKVGIDPATNGWKASLQAIVDAADTRVRETSTLIMNSADADEYSDEINVHVTGAETTSGAPARRFKGKQIEAHPLMPSGKVLFTPMANLVHGLHTTIQRDRAYHARRRAIEYTFDMAFDFEIAVKQFAVLGE